MTHKFGPALQLSIERNSFINQSLDFSSLEIIDGKDYFEINHANLFVKFKKFSYPKFFYNLTSNKLLFGYLFANQDIFQIELSKEGLKIDTPLLGQLQPFFFEGEENFYLADSLAGLLTLKRGSDKFLLDRQGVLDFFNLNFDFSKRTLFQQVKKIAENISFNFFVNQNSISLRKTVKEQLIPMTFSSIKSPIDEFDHLLGKELQAVLTFSQKDLVASCLSGGVDSAVISAKLQQITKVLCESVLVAAESRADQEKILHEMTKSLPLDLMVFDSEKISLFEDFNSLLLADPYIDPYANFSVAMANSLLDQQIDIIFTGMMSDDYYKYYDPLKNNKHENLRVNDNSQYFQDLIVKDQVNLANEDQHLELKSLFKQGSSDSILLYDVPWRNMGVWPVSPFLSAALISFALVLPQEFKEHKKFLKSYLKKTFKKYFAQWDQKITLSSVLAKNILKQSANYSSADINQQLKDLNILNLEKIEILMKEIANGKNLEKNDRILAFLILKLNRFLNIAYSSVLL